MTPSFYVINNLICTGFIKEISHCAAKNGKVGKLGNRGGHGCKSINITAASKGIWGMLPQAMNLDPLICS